MSEYSLYCNNKKCRKAITSIAWITSCSHVFCEQHIHQESEHDRKCNACQNPLTSKYDLIKADLNPSEEFKSMVLAGLSPEIIMDIATRAISFWCHQMFQEKLIQRAKCQAAESQLNNVESSYETSIVKMRNDFEAQNKNYESLKALCDDQTRRIQELEELFSKKNQQLRTLQIKLDSMKRDHLSASLSQAIPPDHHPNVKNNGMLAGFMDQQSMVHCPFSQSQQEVAQKIHPHHHHQSHSHQSHHHNHYAQKFRNESSVSDNIFEFKPDTSNSKSSFQPCSKRSYLLFNKK